VVVGLALGAAACGEQPSPRPTETTAVSPAPSDDAAAIAAAEATVRAFFAVKGRAEDPFSVRIDQQAAYLTARDVHPAAEHAASRGDLPSGITDKEVSVDLSSSRLVGDEVLVDFVLDSTAVSYPLINDEMQLDSGQPGTGHWSGTATLEERDGVWLINGFTTVSSGGTLG
jgi:hypothetical protein